MDLSDDNFDEWNERRLDLIEKKYGKWENNEFIPSKEPLSEEEEIEREILQEKLHSYLDRKHPMDFSKLDEIKKDLDEIDSWFEKEVKND